MSKANSVVKVLRTALKRVDKGWMKHDWYFRDRATGQVFVCMEGGLYGYCHPDKHQLTKQQQEAARIVKEIIKEKYGMSEIPAFNDAPETTKENVMEVLKLGIVRAETGGAFEDDEDEDDFELLEEFETQPSGG